jgi:hypothetical protein
MILIPILLIIFLLWALLFARNQNLVILLLALIFIVALVSYIWGITHRAESYKMKDDRICEDGYTYNRLTDQCVDDDCPEGLSYNYLLNKCTCSSPALIDDGENCVCRKAHSIYNIDIDACECIPGYTMNETGHCVKVCPGANMTRTTEDSLCICRHGYEYDGHSGCKAHSCGHGVLDITTGRCVCNVGYIHDFCTDCDVGCFLNSSNVCECSTAYLNRLVGTG